MWNASRFCMSSLRRGHANLLCIVPILVYVLPRQVHFYKTRCGQTDRQADIIVTYRAAFTARNIKYEFKIQNISTECSNKLGLSWAKLSLSWAEVNVICSGPLCTVLRTEDWSSLITQTPFLLTLDPRFRDCGKERGPEGVKGVYKFKFGDR